MNDQAKEAARKEVSAFFWGNGAYRASGAEDEQVGLFLERNHVVRLPEEGSLEVTEKPGGLYINDRHFASNQDVFYWQKSVEDQMRIVESRGEALRWSVLDLEKRRAVLAFLTDKQAKETQYEAERQARRDQLARGYFEGNTYNALLIPSQNLIDRLIDAEDRVEAIKS